MAPNKKPYKVLLELNKRELCAAASFFYNTVLDMKLFKHELQNDLNDLMVESVACPGGSAH